MTDDARIEAALFAIPADIEREQWWKVAAALKSEMGDAGHDLFDRWSQGGQRYSAIDVRDTWKSTKASGGIGIGTLFSIAKDYGFDPRQHKAEPVDREEAERRRAERERLAEAQRVKIEAEQRTAAKLAADIWAKAEAAPDDHPYLVRKQVKAHGLRLYRGKLTVASMACDGCLIVPARDAGGAITSLEFVSGTGEKRFLPNGRKSGSYHVIGEPGDVMCVAEGYATAASLHEATGYPVAVAFDAGNLFAVADALKAKLPDARLVICADDDVDTPGNPGISKATSAASELGASLAVPDFGADRPEGASDFNDLHQANGLDAVRACVAVASCLADTASPAADGHAADHIGEPAEMVPSNDKTSPPRPASKRQRGPLEPHYALINGGLHFVNTKIDADTGKVSHTAPLWLCDALEVLGSGRDDAARQYRVLQWQRQGNGEPIRLAMPSADIGERDGWAALRNLGLAVTTQPTARHRLAYYLQKEGGTVWYEIVTLTGWQHGAYVLPNGDLIGTPTRQMFYNGGTPKQSAYTPAGSSQTWRDTVGAMARDNPLVVAAIACAFAGPLLSLIGVRDGIGLHLHARTSSGKSTAGDCAASVWGNPADVLHTWDGTSYGLARTAEYANDGLLYLDEIGAGDARKIGPAIYQMLNGVSRLQGTKDGGVVASRSWRLTMISTGEVGMAQYLAEGGQTPRGGQEIRLLDVPADSGAYRAFDCLHGRKDGDAYSTELTAAARANYGTAGRAFVEWLSSRHSEVRAWVSTTQAEMLDAIEAEHPDAAPAARRATRKWGVLVAAAEMASEAGLTGWTRNEARAWVMATWARWLDAFGTKDRDNERLLEQVDGILRANELGRFVLLPLDPHKEPSAQNILGYRNYDANGEPVFLVLPKAFKDEVISGYELRHACKVLHEAGMLDRPRGRRQYTVNTGKPAGMVYRARSRKGEEAEGRHDD